MNSVFWEQLLIIAYGPHEKVSQIYKIKTKVNIYSLYVWNSKM